MKKLGNPASHPVATAEATKKLRAMLHRPGKRPVRDTGPRLTELPKPVTFLNYKGKSVGSVGMVMGPVMLDDIQDQMMTVVTQEYDEKTNMTRLGLTYGALDLSAVER